MAFLLNSFPKCSKSGADDESGLSACSISAKGSLCPIFLPDPEVVSTAAMNMTLLFYPDDKNPLHGPKLVARLSLGPEKRGEREGAILGGLILMGDERITPIIKEVWVQMPPPARTAVWKCEAKQGFALKCSSFSICLSAKSMSEFTVLWQ